MAQDQVLTRRGVATLVAGLATSVSVRAQPRQRLTLLTGAAGGSFNEYGPALASVVAAHAPIDLDIQVTGGSNENIRLVARGEADLGLVNLGPAYDAWTGRPPFEKGDGFRTLRALFPMYETPFSLLALKASGVTGVGGLDGRRVGVGPAGGPGQVFFAGLARELGVRATIVTGSPSDMGRRLLAREIDAFWYGAGLPVSAFVEVLGQAEALVLGLTDKEVAALRRAFAYFAPGEIPAGTYKDQPLPIRTAAVWNFVVGSERLSDEVGYGLTRAALDHTAELAAALPMAAGTAAAHVGTDTFMPLHPGAARYYREKGVAIPAAIAPP